MEKKGFVYLVGAGPGDPGLFTIKGKELLEQAEVVVYDRLVSSDIIAWANPQAELIYVGKESSRHTLSQDEINALLADKAAQGKIVVRLKGGDPFVFGRGGEEAEALAHEEIPFEIIPGISSAIGGLAYAGIPVTHRHYASSFHVVTGHMCQGNEPQNWDVLAQLDGTLIVLMGMTRQEEICQRLIDGGKSPDTPAAAVMYASQQRQEIAKGTLTTLKDEIVRKKLHAPALLVIGHVVNLSDVLAFTARQIDISHEPLLQVI